jgi:hypothetical protein
MKAKHPNMPKPTKAELKESLRTLDNCMSMIEDVVLPDIEARARDIRSACKIARKVTDRLQKQLGVLEKKVERGTPLR